MLSPQPQFLLTILLSHHQVGQSSFWGAVYVLYKAILDCPVLVAAVFGSETWLSQHEAGNSCYLQIGVSLAESYQSCLGLPAERNAIPQSGKRVNISTFL